MSRAKRASGEKRLVWIGSSLTDLLAFPEAVKDEIGAALSVAQFGGKHPNAKPWKGAGPGVFEIVRTTVVTSIGRFTPLDLRTLSMYSTLSKEIAERNQDTEKRCGVVNPAARTGPTGLRGAAWQLGKVQNNR